MSELKDKFYTRISGMEIVLENGIKFNTDDVKCPICGKRMEIDYSNMSFPSTSLEVRHLEHPFIGFGIDQRTVHNTMMICPDSCCKIEFENHIVRNVGHMS